MNLNTKNFDACSMNFNIFLGKKKQFLKKFCFSNLKEKENGFVHN